MTSITNNPERIGAFTSSEIHRLTGIGSRNMTPLELAEHKRHNPTSKARTVRHFDTPDDKFYTYVDEKRREARLKRSLDTGGGSYETRWGELIERRVFDLIGIKYTYQSKTTLVHRDIKHWAGSPDIVADDRVGDIKAYFPKNFTELYDVLEKKSVELFKDEYPKEYWQLVSNACIAGKSKCEIMLYAPYESEAQQIELLANTIPDSDIYIYKNILETVELRNLTSLPFLPDDSGYQNLITFDFEVPEADKLFLTERVKLAVKLLNEKR